MTRSSSTASATKAPTTRKEVEAQEDAQQDQVNAEHVAAETQAEVKKATPTKRDRVRLQATEKGFTLVNHYKGNLWTVENSDGILLHMDCTTGETQVRETAATRKAAAKAAKAAAVAEKAAIAEVTKK